MLSFQELQEKKKTNVKINPKKEEMMEKSDVIDSGTSTEELYDSQEEVVEESSEESETQTTLLTFEERAARKMTLRNLQTLKKKTIPAGEKAESKRKKEGKGEYSAAYKKKETDVTNYDDKAPAKKAAPKKKAVTAVKKVTPKAAPKKSEPKAKAKPAPKKAAPKPVAKKEAPKKETPKSKSVGDKARDWVKKGIKRHRKATQGARVFGKGFAKGVKTAVKVAKDVKKVVSEGKTYSQFMKEMNNFNHSANQRGALSTKFGFKFGSGTGQNKFINLNIGTGDSTSKIAGISRTQTHGTGYTGNEVRNAENRLNQIQHGGDGGWTKEEIAKQVAKERRYGKAGIASTGGPNSNSSKIRQEEVELKTMNELFGLFKGRGQSGGNTGGGTIQKGGYNHAKTSPKSGNNPVLGFARNLLGNKQNKAPAATFFQSQQKKQKMIDQILGNSYEPEGEMVEGNQRDPEGSKKDRTHSKQPDPSKDGFTGIGNMSIKDIMKMNAKIKAKSKKESSEPEGEELKEYSPNVTYQAKGGKKSGKLGKSSVYSLKDKGESKKEFRKSQVKDIKGGYLKTEEKKKGLDGKECWDGYKLAGTKKKGGKTVDNCVKTEDYHSGQGEKIQKRTKKWMDKVGQKGAPGLNAMKARTAEHKAKRGVKEEVVDEGVGGAIKAGVKRHKDAVEKKKIKNRKAVPYAALAAEHNPEGKSLAELATGILKNKPGSLASEVMSGLQAAKKVPNTAKIKVKSSEVAKNVKEKSEASVNEVTKVTCDKRKKVPAYKTTDLLAGSLKREEVEVVDEAKVDKGRSDYGKASIRNYRRSGPGHGEPAMFDPENKRGKTIDKRREEHKARRGKKGAKVPAYKVEETQVDEATRLKKEKGYDKGGTKKPSGKPTAMSVVLDKIRKQHGHGAVVGQGGSRQDKKKKGAKSDAGTGKYLKRAKEKAAYKVKAKKAGFKSTQDYTDTMARYGGEDNYKKGKGLGT